MVGASETVAVIVLLVRLLADLVLNSELVRTFAANVDKCAEEVGE